MVIIEKFGTGSSFEMVMEFDQLKLLVYGSYLFYYGLNIMLVYLFAGDNF